MAGKKKAEASFAVPSNDVLQSAMDQLLAVLKEAVLRANDRLPPELKQDPNVVLQVLNQEFAAVNFDSWRAQLFAELAQAWATGKSDVRHDPTELA